MLQRTSGSKEGEGSAPWVNEGVAKPRRKVEVRWRTTTCRKQLLIYDDVMNDQTQGHLRAAPPNHERARRRLAPSPDMRARRSRGDGCAKRSEDSLAEQWDSRALHAGMH